ncbi:Ricin B lectin [Kribbella flavida DSM 17836]|uniref:Ricin B lectin n=1 Tax=Kribbella flavida (strain DSM 17836 / JCM 10339 / NBRC 14399) TaxID=479435 RepID=D2PPW3_KRIFD|nr:ricin-type beta-trefoil lectin domain protein [Kribbella flavida]ADB32887.1 Ricin B lectin [Kribbella flavida DSM 17836]
MSIRSLMTRTGATLVVAALAASTTMAGSAQAGSAPAPDRAAESAAAPAADLPIGKPRQFVNRVQTKLCLTFAVTPDGIPTAVMIKCNKGSKGKIQQWTYTADQQLMVSMSKNVGGDLPNGACLDTAADLTTVQGQTPLLVLPCRAGDGQKWLYDKEKGSLINKASGKALSSMIGVAKQARPTSTVPYTGGKDQKWRDTGIPMETLIGAVVQLLDALLEALGLEMPDEYETRGQQMLKAIDGKVPVPEQLKQLPKQMVKMAG